MADVASHATDCTVILDPEGDIMLLIGANPTRKFLVSSSVLARNSPVFSRMLREPYKEGRELARAYVCYNFSLGLGLQFDCAISKSDGTIYELALPDDNPDRMEKILNLFYAKAVIPRHGHEESDSRQISSIL